VNPSWSRDNRILAGIALVLGALMTGLYALVLRARELPATAATNQVLLFVLFYIVLLLILALLFVLVRSAVKLVLDSRRGLFGSRFRVRIVLSHVGLALLPIALLILPTTGLLQRSVETWFRPPVVETVRSGARVVDLVRERSAAAERRAAERLARKLAELPPGGNPQALLAAAREESGLDLIEWREEGRPEPVAVSSPRWPIREARDPGPDWLADARSRGRARRIETTADGGQVSRTVFALPGGLLVLGAYESPDEAAPVQALARATSTYAMLESERASLAAVQVLLFLVLAFLVLVAAVWVGLLLARRVTRPIAALAASARRVGAGDFEALVDVEDGDEIGALSGAFNAMTAELRMSREKLVATNAEMVETNRRVDDERRIVKTILAHLDAGVVAFTDDRTLLASNDTAHRLLHRAAGEQPRTVDDLLSDEPLSPLRAFLTKAMESGPREATVTLSFPEGGVRVVEARLAHVPAESGGTWVVTLEDTTALVRAERAAAWEEAARRMAHEIKNPLTPIRLAAERMRRRALGGKDASGELTAVVDEGATTIIEEVKTLADLVDTFGRFARLPAADLTEADLGAVVTQVAKLYSGVRPGVCVSASLPERLPLVKADPEQVKRALINLVDNAVAAVPSGGKVTIGVSVDDGRARLVVADDGPGISAADRARVFDPAFSTKARGTGLGLAITARIAAEHGGTVTVGENAPHGCRFVFEWPAA